MDKDTIYQLVFDIVTHAIRFSDTLFDEDIRVGELDEIIKNIDLIKNNINDNLITK